MCVKLRHTKFQRSRARRTFLNSGLNGGVEKSVFFKRSLAMSRKRCEIRLRLLLVTTGNRKWHISYENHRPWITFKVTDNQ